MARRGFPECTVSIATWSEHVVALLVLSEQTIHNGNLLALYAVASRYTDVSTSNLEMQMRLLCSHPKDKRMGTSLVLFVHLGQLNSSSCPQAVKTSSSGHDCKCSYSSYCLLIQHLVGISTSFGVGLFAENAVMPPKSRLAAVEKQIAAFRGATSVSEQTEFSTWIYPADYQ